MLKLFFAPTAPSLRVLLFLEESGIPYSSLPINVFKKQNHHETYAKIIPTKKTPAMLDGESVLFESAAMMLHLAHKHETLLAMENLNTMLSWYFWGVSELNPKFSQYHHADNANEDMMLRLRKQLDSLLALLNTQLEGKDYIAGEYSIADINLYPSIKVRSASIGGLLDNMPNISKWMDNISKKEATKRVLHLAESFDRESTIEEEEIKNFLQA
ncbi:MAG: glutathione S-transferase family protein [Alphaproteobacteria bacterium]|jgi:GST-like protein|nr:glutathione S-transferase family protein [Alphaproteobacteria bacterium]